MSDTCATCAHWSATLPPLATGSRRPEGADPRLGVCQLYPPEIVRTAGLWASVFPEVHADRSCGEWSPDFDPDGDGGEAVQPSAESTVVPFERAA